MTTVDYLPILTEIFGSQLIEPSKLPRASRSGFSGSTVSSQWFEWRNGELVRAGSIDELRPIYNKFKADGNGSDLQAILAEWDRGSTARMKDEAAAIIREILLEKRVPWQDKYGNKRLHLGWAEIDVGPDESTEELAERAIETLNEELGLNLRFETGRNFTKDEIARVRASLPQAEEPTPPAQPDAENDTPESESAPLPVAQTSLAPGSREVREFLSTLTAQAKAATRHIIEESKHPGLLQIALVHPTDEKVSGIYRYELNDPDLIERMTSDALNANESGHNVYIEGRTVRRGLGAKVRGALEDTVAVFALVVDSDNDKGKAWSPTAPVSLTVETSPGNRHFWLFLEIALDPATAQKLGARLRARTNADDDTGNVCQPYRVAGTTNYPGEKKRARGRVVTGTHTLSFDLETLWTPERLEQEFPATTKAPTTSKIEPQAPPLEDLADYTVAKKFADLPIEDLGVNLTLDSIYPPEEIAALRALGYADKAIWELEPKQVRKILGADPELIAAALAVIPRNDNDEHDDNYWTEIGQTPGRRYMVQVGMAVKAASNGSAEGFALFDKWRSGAPDYDADRIRKKWDGFHPTKISFGTLSFYADKAAPEWRENYDAQKSSDREASDAPDEQPKATPGFDVSGGGPTPTEFYRKDEIDEAIALGRTILIVESKEDADYLWSIGIPATIGNGEWTCFKDADVVVHEYVQAARRHLRGIAKRVRILHFLEYAKKISGHTSEGAYTREELDKLIEQAPDYAPAVEGLGEWDAGDDPGPIPPRQWLLGNQFCRSFISSIVAAGGAGKSALRMLQFISMALGRSLCGQHVFRRCRVLLISLEDDRNELQRRIKAVLDYYDRVLRERGEPGIERKDLKGWLFCASPKLAKLAEMKNRTRTIGPLEQYVRDAIKRRNPDIIGLDPFIKTHSLEENDSGDMDFVCDLLARMAIEFNIAVDSPHHVHKGQVTPGDADSGRGSSGIRDAGRLVYTLAPMTESDAKLFNINPNERFSYIRLDSAKVNLTVRSGKAEWFHIVGQPIGNSTDEYPNGDTIQVVKPWTPPDAWKDTTHQGLNTILTDIDYGLTDDDGKPTGRRYSNAPAATDRAVWPVVQKHYPDKSEAQCREIIHSWLDIKLLYPEEYDDPVQRRKLPGLKVDNSKRPS